MISANKVVCEIIPGSCDSSIFIVPLKLNFEEMTFTLEPSVIDNSFASFVQALYNILLISTSLITTSNTTSTTTKV